MSKKKEPVKGAVHVKIKSGDLVIVTTGKDKTKRGKVMAVKPREGKLKIEGLNIIKKHQKPNPQLGVEGGIVQKENWIDISNVQLIDPESGKATRVRYEFDGDGKKIRIAVASGKPV